jgi:hypothetical protein
VVRGVLSGPFGIRRVRRLRATCQAPYVISTTSSSVRSTPREARSAATYSDVAAPISPIVGMPKATRQKTAPPATQSALDPQIVRTRS